MSPVSGRLHHVGESELHTGQLFSRAGEDLLNGEEALHERRFALPQVALAHAHKVAVGVDSLGMWDSGLARGVGLSLCAGSNVPSPRCSVVSSRRWGPNGVSSGITGCC